MRCLAYQWLFLSLVGVMCGSAVLFAVESSDTTTLFNGSSFSAWQSAQGKAPSGWEVKEGAMVLKKGGGDIWTKDRFGDFVLSLEFKTKGNSGIFIRTDKPADPVQTGIEIQVDNPSRNPGKHSVGSIYDLVAPSKDVGKKDDWNKVIITAKGSKLAVEMNGEKITEMDLDRWTEASKNPDGSANKFAKALKDFKREGYIGFQDHGSDVMYRNVEIRSLK
jgi:3-keto-disaccharide hydrolase